MVEFTKRNPYLKNLAIFVHTLRKDQVGESVIYRVLQQLSTTKTKDWWGLGIFLSRKYGSKQEELEVNKRKNHEKTNAFLLSCEEMRIEKEKRTGPPPDLMGQFIANRIKIRTGEI